MKKFIPLKTGRINSIRFKISSIIFSRDSNFQVCGCFYKYTIYIIYIQGELYWTHHWQKNFTIPDLGANKSTEKWVDQDKFPEDDDVSDTSSRLVINTIFSVLILKELESLPKNKIFWSLYHCNLWPNLKNLSGGLNLSRGLNMVGST